MNYRLVMLTIFISSSKSLPNYKPVLLYVIQGIQLEIRLLALFLLNWDDLIFCSHQELWTLTPFSSLHFTFNISEFLSAIQKQRYLLKNKIKLHVIKLFKIKKCKVLLSSFIYQTDNSDRCTIGVIFFFFWWFFNWLFLIRLKRTKLMIFYFFF